MPMVLPRSKPREMPVNISPVLLDHGKDDRRHQWFAGRLDRLDAHVRLRVIGRHHHFQNAARRHGDYALRYDDVLGPAAGILTELHIGIGDIAPVHTQPQVETAKGSRVCAPDLGRGDYQIRSGFADGDLVVLQGNAAGRS